MEHHVYLLVTDSQDPDRDVIHSRDTGLKVRVFDLEKTSFQPDSSEIQLFAYANGTLLGFETINVTADDALDVLEAIKWYARYIGSPQMEILPEDPRVGHQAVVQV